MNREIKFRCWDTGAKEMREVAMLRWEDGRMSRIAGYWPDTRNNGWTDYDPAEDKYVLMQFTGLKDKHGKDVFEGDICEIEMRYNPSIRREVTFSYGSFGFGKRNDRFFDATRVSVIGNIYENPELL